MFAKTHTSDNLASNSKHLNQKVMEHSKTIKLLRQLRCKIQSDKEKLDKKLASLQAECPHPEVLWLAREGYRTYALCLICGVHHEGDEAAKFLEEDEISCTITLWKPRSPSAFSLLQEVFEKGGYPTEAEIAAAKGPKI